MCIPAAACSLDADGFLRFVLAVAVLASLLRLTPTLPAASFLAALGAAAFLALPYSIVHIRVNEVKSIGARIYCVLLHVQIALNQWYC
jgi:hypothetical protein